jgi:hypothetical protein
MIRFVADEDFNYDVVRPLRRALPEIDLLIEATRGDTHDHEVRDRVSDAGRRGGHRRLKARGAIRSMYHEVCAEIRVRVAV